MSRAAMTVPSRSNAGRTTALLLLALALLVFAARGAQHGHDTQPLPGDNLCAICAYGGATLGGIATPTPLPALPAWQPAPDSTAYRSTPAPARAAARIRGPPASA